MGGDFQGWAGLCLHFTAHHRSRQHQGGTKILPGTWNKSWAKPCWILLRHDTMLTHLTNCSRPIQAETGHLMELMFSLVTSTFFFFFSCENSQSFQTHFNVDFQYLQTALCHLTIQHEADSPPCCYMKPLWHCRRKAVINKILLHMVLKTKDLILLRAVSRIGIFHERDCTQTSLYKSTTGLIS